HPMASAVLAAAKQRALTWTPAEEFESISGKGVRARVGGQDVILGNRALLEERRVDLRGTPAVATAESLSSTTIHVAIDGRIAGAIAIADPIKAGAREALDALRAEGLRIVMLTGDVQETAVAVGRALGIARDDVHAGVLPANKRDVVRDLQSRGAVVAMAGDGATGAPGAAEAADGSADGTGPDRASARPRGPP